MYFKFPIFVTWFVFTFVYISSLSSTFSIVLFNSFISTSKIVNDIPFFFFTLFCFTPTTDLSHSRNGSLWTLSSSYSSLKARRMKNRCKLTSSIFFQDQLRKIIHEKKPNLKETQSFKFHKAAINKW